MTGNGLLKVAVALLAAILASGCAGKYDSEIKRGKVVVGYTSQTPAKVAEAVAKTVATLVKPAKVFHVFVDRVQKTRLETYEVKLVARQATGRSDLKKGVLAQLRVLAGRLAVDVSRSMGRRIMVKLAIASKGGKVLFYI